MLNGISGLAQGAAFTLVLISNNIRHMIKLNYR